jgi:hypothetical protein
MGGTGSEAGRRVNMSKRKEPSAFEYLMEYYPHLVAKLCGLSHNGLLFSYYGSSIDPIQSLNMPIVLSGSKTIQQTLGICDERHTLDMSEKTDADGVPYTYAYYEYVHQLWTNIIDCLEKDILPLVQKYESKLSAKSAFSVSEKDLDIKYSQKLLDFEKVVEADDSNRD